MRPSIEVHKHIHVDAEGRTLSSERPYFVRRYSSRQQEQYQSQYQSRSQLHDPDHSRARIIQFQYYPTTAYSAPTVPSHVLPHSHTHTHTHAQSMPQNYRAPSGQDIHTLRTAPHRLHKVETDLHGLIHGNHNHELRIRALEKEKKRSERKEKNEKEMERLLKRERERVQEREVQRLLKEQEGRRVQVEYSYPSWRGDELVDELAIARYRRQIETFAAVERERLREKRLDEMIERMRHDGWTSEQRLYGYASW